MRLQGERPLVHSRQIWEKQQARWLKELEDASGKHLCDAMSITTMTDRAGWEEEINEDVFGELIRQGGFRNESIKSTMLNTELER